MATFEELSDWYEKSKIEKVVADQYKQSLLEEQQHLSHKVSSLMRWLVIVVALFVCVTVTVCIIFLNNKNDTTAAIQQQQAKINSYQAKDSVRAVTYTVLTNRVKYFEDGLHKQDAKIAQYNNSITNIKTKYEKVRNHYASLPVNQQLHLFAEWLSQIDSTVKR